MKKVSAENYIFILPTVLFLLLAFYFIARPVYGYTSTWDDDSSKYWHYTKEDPYCGSPENKTKRPTQTIHAVSAIYYKASLTGRTGNNADVNDWRQRQGNCPMQVMDIHKSGMPLDLLFMSAAFGASAYVSFRHKTPVVSRKD